MEKGSSSFLSRFGRSVLQNDVPFQSLAAAQSEDQKLRLARFWLYPKEVLYFICSFIALVSLWHWASIIYTVNLRKRVQVERQRRGNVSLRRLPAAVADGFRALSFRWAVPVGPSYTLNPAEVFMAMAYTAILFTCTLINTTTTTGIKVEPHYFANRAATIASTQLPIMVALGTRNNIFSFLTGISFDKLNFLHRISARVLCVLFWLHGAGRLMVGLTGDEALVNNWVKCGFLAASALTLMVFLFLRPVRERNYQVFLFLHFFLAFIFLLSAYFHVRGRDLTYYGVWPSMVVWGLDRFLRLLRIGVFNFRYINPRSSTSFEYDATVEALSSNFVRVTIQRPSYLHWRPGQSVFLSFPSVSKFPFESHPFTIANIDESTSTGSLKKLIFLMKIRQGFTKRLLNKASEGKTLTTFVDGPYSSPPLLIGYDTVMMIAGGSGVTFTLPFLLDLISKSQKSKATVYGRKVIFIWAIRNIDHVQWIGDILESALSSATGSIEIEIQLYVTTISEIAWEDDSKENLAEKAGNNDDFDHPVLEMDNVNVQQGRPDIQSIIDNEVGQAKGSIFINVCGSRTLTAAVRSAVKYPRFMDVLRGAPTIKLHVEAFGNN